MKIKIRTASVFLFFTLFTTLSFGSVIRIEISKATQTDSPIHFSVEITPDNHLSEYYFVELTLPSEQKQLASLWKIDLCILEEAKTALSAPLELNRDKNKTITVRYSGNIETIRQSVIAIRCGERAPFSETIYQIKIGSYLKNTEEQIPSEQ